MSEEVISSVEIHFESDSYHLLTKTIRQGGLGEIYKAKQKNTDRQVAIKSLSPNSVDADKKRGFIDHFERETQWCSRSQHPKTVQLLDKDRYQAHYLHVVFEYVGGLIPARKTLATASPSPSEQLCSEPPNSKPQYMREGSSLSNSSAATRRVHCCREPYPKRDMHKRSVLAA